jgi:hypothetical protein
MYTQSSVLPSFADSPASIQTLSQQQKTTVTQAIRNPIKIDRNSMTLENDACYRNKWYIKFKYTTDIPVHVNCYLNTVFDENPQNYMN